MVQKVPLREWKKAKTKQALLQACLELVGEKSFREVYVDELCRKVEISKVTFFRFFPKKEDLLLYFMRLWLTDRLLELAESPKRGLQALRHLFQKLDEDAKENPGIMLSLIGFLTEEKMHPCMPELTEAEYHLYYPGKEERAASLAPSLYELFQRCVEEAMEDREIAADRDVNELVIGLFTIFYGAYLTTHLYQSQDFISFYELHLKLLLR
ncbi:TetR/AcrR family transcriptional regulator [Brevibacillus ruminantium]|uniref:TetR/AcrR family transcriptional regulator n=1 Tax=Brevibacillus ruminantium TaxID=2950604 RepID=A0ABY4WP45_9BACL|nr:TetR/AcrR family transcriptional regulator [Brevibacillus ruminantium]USG67159.1 TetR/AcrR family transcriptional regulator [Brevibacillus ruminantium]